MRLQLALNVRDLKEAVEYYSKLFAVKPHKLRDGYANFAIDTPPLKLVLFENPEAEERLNHLGVEVFDEAEIASATERFEAAGIMPEVQHRRRVAMRPRTRCGPWNRKDCAGNGIESPTTIPLNEV